MRRRVAGISLQIGPLDLEIAEKGGGDGFDVCGIAGGEGIADLSVKINSDKGFVRYYAGIRYHEVRNREV